MIRHSMETNCSPSSILSHTALLPGKLASNHVFFSCSHPMTSNTSSRPKFLLAFMYITVLISWRNRMICLGSCLSRQDMSNCTCLIWCRSGRERNASRQACMREDMVGPSTPPLSSVGVSWPEETGPKISIRSIWIEARVEIE